MSEMQDADGAFPWLDYNLEPFESKEARTYGASLAAISYGQLSLISRPSLPPRSRNFAATSAKSGKKTA